MKSTNEAIRKKLFELADPEYRVFQAKLVPGRNIDEIIGIRTPVLRKYAKEINGTKEAEEFLSVLPHDYYDEDNLHAFLISLIKDYGKCVDELDRFLPYVDNWATCDQMRPAAFNKNTALLEKDIRRWITSEKTYTVRFAVEMLMTFFLDDRFKPEFNNLVASVKSSEYYVNMMLAWYFATALSKQWDATVTAIENGDLDTWVHNKTIQKAIESYRITDEQKVYLRSLKRK